MQSNLAFLAPVKAKSGLKIAQKRVGGVTLQCRNVLETQAPAEASLLFVASQ